MNYNSTTVPGHDYSKPLRDMLPTIIGKRSKSVPQIAEEAGRKQATVRSLIVRLHAKNALHIKRWKRAEVGPYVPFYFWGPGVDAPRPEPQTRAAIYKRYQQSEKGKKRLRAWRKSERGVEYRTAFNKGRWAREKFSKGGIAAIDPLLAAIMGRRNQPEKEL